MAEQTIRVSLPGYDALIDTNPDHFALYTDETNDYVLIKERTRGSAQVLNNITKEMAHGLGYVPFCLVFSESSTGVYRKLFSHPVDGTGVWFEINATALLLKNTSGSTKTFKYYIFYDLIQ